MLFAWRAKTLYIVMIIKMEEQKLLKRKLKAQSEGNKTLLLSVSISLAELYFHEGKYEAAIHQYKLISKIYLEQEKVLEYACANRMIGEAYTYLQNFEKALKHQKIHLAVSKEQGNKLEEQRAFATIGHIHLTSYLHIIDNPDKSSLTLAAKNFMESLNICESLKCSINKREYMDILSRLYSNLGIVQECKGNFKEGIDLLKKSINICKANDIFEQLERGYASLGSLYARTLDYSSAIENYSLAMKVAGRLENKIPLICASLSSKAEIYIKGANFQAAKIDLLKAYKLKTPHIADKENIEQNLRVVASMCYTEDALVIASDTDYKLKKKLYEKMGDGACYLKNFTKGIEYYKKMLEMAELNGDTDKDLSMCYISLAQTYHDNKEYDLATNYFKKDYEICKNNTKESVNSLLIIAENMDLAGKDIDKIIMIYNQARLASQNVSDKELEAKSLRNLINFLKKNNKLSEASKLEIEFDNLDFKLSESDSEDVEEIITENIGHDIDIDNITDHSDGSDTEMDINKPRTARTRNKSLVIKKNAKGETQLHIACINGNVALVQKLLDQGHVVNIRDNCGWLPIHEACICGHKTIVEMLLAKGAAINDRGGINCNGMTPLHDAASNGHLEIIELMLIKGASAIAKTDDGETPLELLNIWRNTVDLDPIEQTYYEMLVGTMMKALEKAGHTEGLNNFVQTKKSLGTRKYVSEPSRTQFSQQNEVLVNRVQDNTLVSRYKGREGRDINKRNHSSVKIGDLRRKIDSLDDIEEIGYGDSDDFETSSKFNSSTNQINLTYRNADSSRNCIDSEDSCDSINAADEYIMEMKHLRYRKNIIEPVKKRKSADKSKRSALLSAEEVGEDWLEDDIGNMSKKRKTNVEDPFTNAMKVYNKNDISRRNNKENVKNNYADNLINVEKNCNVSDESSESMPESDEYLTKNVNNSESITESRKKYKSPEISNRSLLSAEKFGENWLEDNIDNTTKHKTHLENTFTNTTNVYNKNVSSTNNEIVKNNSKDNFQELIENHADEFMDDILDFEIWPIPNKRKHQSTLINAGFTRKHSSSPNSLRRNSTEFTNTSSHSLNESQTIRKSQVKITDFVSTIDADSTSDIVLEMSMDPTISSTIKSVRNDTINKQILSIDVRIEEKLFRIPVPISDLNVSTIRWLAGEATSRFYRKEAMKPILELQTKTGAVLSEDDFVGILFSPEGLQSEEVLGKVKKWYIPSVVERYKDSCSNINLALNEDLFQLLEETSSSHLNLEDKHFGEHLYPLCTVLSSQINLRDLNISGNYIGDKGIELLCESLPTLHNLRILNVSLNNISEEGISSISKMLIQSGKPMLNNLSNLDLSHNPLGDESFKYLAVITRFLKLNFFSLLDVDFTNDIFNDASNSNLELCLDYVENFDLSYNKLSKADIIKFVSWLKTRNLKKLNVGNNNINKHGLVTEIVQLLQKGGGLPELKIINFSRCNVTDEDVYELLRILITANNLEELDLSYNDDITSISLKRILETASLTKLIINSCNNLTQNMDNAFKLNDSAKKCRILQTTLNNIENGKECDILINFWKNEYQELAGVDGLSKGLLNLYVADIDQF